MWLARGLPPFTITFVKAKPNGDLTRKPLSGYLAVETPEEPECAAFSLFA